MIGVSRVTIPTLFHPKAPYFVLVLEDERGNRWAQKSIKEYKIGDVIEYESRQDKKAVALWRIKYEVLEGMEKVIDLVDGLKINPGAKILILPSLISPRHPYFADNTSPLFLETAIKYLLERGVKSEDIKVVGQGFDEISIEACAKKSGLLDVCLKNKVQVLDLVQTNFIRKENFEISGEVFSSDLVINLPILKIGQASASENVFKFLKKENYLGLKYLSSDEEIFQGLIKHLPLILTLADAQNVQKRDQFVVFLGLVLASFDTLNLDRVFAEICLLKELPEILKKIKIEDIEILGREIGEVQCQLEKF